MADIMAGAPPRSPGPLAGIRVVELTMWVAGPACAGLLAEWGAEVIKVEGPNGDPARSYQRMLGGDLPSNPPFELDNRSKRSIVIDLHHDDGRALMDELLAQADVFVANVRASALKRFGLDYERVHARHPRLIYAFISGYGLEGDEADRPAYDIAAFWSRAGIASLLTAPGGDPPFQRGGMGDHSVGMSTAAGVCAALFARERTGEGQLVSSSLLRQGAYTIGFDLNTSVMWGRTLQLGVRQAMFNPAMNNYTAGDGRRFWIVGQEVERHWPPLCRAVAHPEWLEDERFATLRARRTNIRELIALLDEIFATKPLAEWAEIFDRDPDFFWAPVNTVDDLLADAQFHASGGLVTVPDDSTGTTMINTPVDFSQTPAAPRSLAPELGEHTHEILRELGHDDSSIAALEGRGVVRPATADQTENV